ncbi:flavin-containing monooxygenase [Glaciibacter sp. 2TAF33]|uniref:flavin-containing monooxygenase n=1 Tax=Glaciibacter sp. 2TAF33 TaxID=3233015 RepID=UPI003F8F4C5A
MSEITHIPTVVVGGGQAGLAVGRELSRRGQGYLILERNPRIGESWRRRWDSLRLFTPAQYDALPDLPFPAARGSVPTKDEVAGYLEDYASVFGLRVELGRSVTRAARSAPAGASARPANDGSASIRPAWRLDTDAGPITADNVVVATGTNDLPRTPELAAGLREGIRQLHASEYRNPAQLPAGDVLVVGAGTSGAEIAIELAATHRVVLAGRPTVHIPEVLFKRAGGLYWRFVSSVLTRSTPMGRRAAAGFLNRGAPLIRVSMDQVDRAGVERRGRVEGTADGWPVVEGRAVQPATIIWATGYRPDFSWLDGLEVDQRGWPVHERGVVGALPGLYFVGIPFQYALTSGLLGGVGRDAAYIADQLVRTPARENALVGVIRRS